MSLAPGTCLGPYTIENRLASGGMGAVYRALDTRLGRRVALKVLLPTFAVDPERLKRFQQEAQATSTLNHPNILTIHDLGTHEGEPYLVSELLEGGTLRERMAGLPTAGASSTGISNRKTSSSPWMGGPRSWISDSRN